jgi:hypothetical protein
MLTLRQPFPLSNHPFDLEAAKYDPQILPFQPQRPGFDSFGDNGFEIRQFENLLDGRRWQDLTAGDVCNVLSQRSVAASIDQLQRSIGLNGKTGRCRFARAVFLQVGDDRSRRLNAILTRRQ